MKQRELYSLEMNELLFGRCVQDCDRNPFLIKHIKTNIAKPSGRSPVLENPEAMQNKTGQVDRILKHFNNKKDGFFIEAGAGDGEATSNTVFMEAKLGWSGLLVEPNKAIFDSLGGKKRNVFSIQSCLSRHRFAEKLKFDTDDVFGDIVAKKTETVQCFPLYSLLLALGNPRVDFLSLDVDGDELDVLRTIPFDMVDIEMFLIKTKNENSTIINDLMSQSGYELKSVPSSDLMFVKTLVN